MAGRVVIIMGSKSDLEHAKKIGAELDSFAVPYALRIASAHKSVRHLLAILDQYRDGDQNTVFITVAGRSNALSGMVDANISWPVIACPPVSSSFGGADIYSSLRMPGGVAPMLVLEPEAAALAAVKILAVGDAALRARIVSFQARMTEQITEADKSLS
jgi:5-(carboxyamino)imidazole ribonucleotide mutase